MGLVSRGGRAGGGRSASGGLWVLAALPVLCVVSYPVAVLGQRMPLGSLVSMLVIVGLLVLVAHGGQREPRSLSVRAGCVVAIWANLVVGSAAWLGDGAEEGGVLDLLIVTTLAMGFAGHFLYWLVADAAPEALPARLGFEPFPGKRTSALMGRAGLAVVVMLGLLVFGLGAVWSRGEEWVPSPVPWVVALVFFSFLLMFAERVRYFGRSARDGNLLLALRSREKWIAAGVLVLVAAALVAAAFPWHPPRPEERAARVGTRAERGPAPPGVMETLGREAAARAESLAGGVGAAFARAPRVFSVLWLLLVALLVGVMLVWLFSRTRAARWVLGAVATVLAACVRRWRRLMAWLRGAFSRGRKAEGAVEEGESPLQADPLFDVFEDAEALSRLSAREIAIHTYHLMLNFAEMLGRGRRPGQTPFEYGRGLAGAVPVAEHAVMALTWGYAHAMYGGEHVSLPPASAVRESWQRVAEALTTGLSTEELELRQRAYLASRAMAR